MIRNLAIGMLMSGCVATASPAEAGGVDAGKSDKVAIGSWVFTSTADPMSDKRSARIETNSGGKTFLFQCDAPGPGSIYPLFSSDQYLGGAGAGYGRRQIMIRFDTDDPLSPTWVYKGPIAFIPHDHPQAVALMARASTAHKLAIRATTYNSEFVDAVFELGDTQLAVAKLVEACQDGPA